MARPGSSLHRERPPGRSSKGRGVSASSALQTVKLDVAAGGDGHLVGTPAAGEIGVRSGRVASARSSGLQESEVGGVIVGGTDEVDGRGSVGNADPRNLRDGVDGDVVEPPELVV